jgi:uncharacterized protein (DUF924 family)
LRQKTLKDQQDINKVLEFWFSDDPDNPMKHARSWWEKNSAFDARIKAQFESLILGALKGELDSWKSDVDGVLAFILVTDQFPRNAYRNQPESFSLDAIALKATLESIDRKMDEQCGPIQRWFMYMPLEHSENLEHQNTCVQLFESMTQEVEEAFKPAIVQAYHFAKLHQQVIEKYGRFPHRNAILGRSSTEEELAFLKQPNSGF